MRIDSSLTCNKALKGVIDTINPLNDRFTKAVQDGDFAEAVQLQERLTEQVASAKYFAQEGESAVMGCLQILQGDFEREVTKLSPNAVRSPASRPSAKRPALKRHARTDSKCNAVQSRASRSSARRQASERKPFDVLFKRADEAMRNENIQTVRDCYNNILKTYSACRAKKNEDGGKMDGGIETLVRVKLSVYNGYLNPTSTQTSNDIRVAVKRDYEIQRIPDETLPLGLRNPSCNCWINATFNALIACDDLRSRILTTFDAGNDELREKMAPLVEAIRKYERELKIRPNGNISSVNTQDLREWVHKNQSTTSRFVSPVSTNYRVQEDAMAFFEVLQDFVHMNYSMMSKTTNTLPSGLSIASEGSSDNSSTHISFELDEEANLPFKELLDRSFNSYDSKAEFGRNPETNKPYATEMHQTKRLVEAPGHLMIQAKRFVGRVRRDAVGELIFNSDGSVAMEKQKINHKIDFPMELTLDKEYCSSQPNYRLKSFIHQGGNLNGGHYKSYVRYGEQWFCANDDSIQKIATKDVPFGEAYITFYEKIDAEDSHASFDEDPVGNPSLVKQGSSENLSDESAGVVEKADSEDAEVIQATEARLPAESPQATQTQAPTQKPGWTWGGVAAAAVTGIAYVISQTARVALNRIT